jgi:hypothetical protein|tara:strand:+ start:147 stop:371 length:225 start_codon:yes stop_codon:yes gene_type:complete
MIAIIFLFLGLLNSKVLTPLNKIWFKFGVLLGSFVSPIVMSTDLGKLVIGNCYLDKKDQNLSLKKDYTKEFELD